MALMI